MSVICNQCRTANPENSQFCSQCGNKLLSDMEITASFAGLIDIGEEAKIDFDQLRADEPIIVIVKGSNVGQTFQVGQADIVIGRDPDSNIFLDDVTVSRKHAQIITKDGRPMIVDAGSLNGTYLNKERVERAYLANRDEIQIGKFKMIFLDNLGEKRGVG